MRKVSMLRPACSPRPGLLLLVLLVRGDDATAEDSGQANAAHELFVANGCAECHGPNAEGTDTAPTPLAGTRMILQQFQTRVRNGRGSTMPAHTADPISDDEIQMLYEWLRE
jgi:mono/diheme cytochrome c family protein